MRNENYKFSGLDLIKAFKELLIQLDKKEITEMLYIQHSLDLVRSLLHSELNKIKENNKDFDKEELFSLCKRNGLIRTSLINKNSSMGLLICEAVEGPILRNLSKKINTEDKLFCLGAEVASLIYMGAKRTHAEIAISDWHDCSLSKVKKGYVIFQKLMEPDSIDFGFIFEAFENEERAFPNRKDCYSAHVAYTKLHRIFIEEQNPLENSQKK